MSPFFLRYIFLVSSAGFAILTIFSILAFSNIEALKIQKDRNLQSGGVLLITAIVKYF
jgi:hypothetical protein